VTASTTARFAHEPQTEQEVICLFGALLPYLDEPLIIDAVRTLFPDCLARSARVPSKRIRIEFELYGHHFIQHRHDPEACDMIVCWLDDWGQWPASLTVVQLRDVVREKCPSLIEHIGDRLAHALWDRASFIEECRRSGLSSEQLHTVEAILSFAESHKLGPQWLSDAKGSFAVRDREQFFKVYADGTLAFPFSRLDSGDLFPALARDINDALGLELVTPADAKRKGIGGDVVELFPTPDRLENFLAVWASFARKRRDA
jgi:hypothetical protein